MSAVSCYRVMHVQHLNQLAVGLEPHEASPHGKCSEGFKQLRNRWWHCDVVSACMSRGCMSGCDLPLESGRVPLKLCWPLPEAADVLVMLGLKPRQLASQLRLSPTWQAGYSPVLSKPMVWAMHARPQQKTVAGKAEGSQLQQLYSTAKHTLLGATQPGPAEVEKLKAALGWGLNELNRPWMASVEFCVMPAMTSVLLCSCCATA